MSSPTPHEDHEQDNQHANDHAMLTPHGKQTMKKHGGRIGLVGAGVLVTVAAIYGPSACSPKNYDAINQQWLSAYDNNSGEITMSRIFWAAHMFEATSTALAEDGFNNLYNQIDRTLDQNGWEYIPFTKNAQNSHGTPVGSINTNPNPAFDSYHCYIGVNKKWDKKEIIVSWHNPEPTRSEKDKGFVWTHKVAWSHKKWQKVVQRVDYYSNGRVVGPQAYNFEQFIGELEKLKALYN